MSDLIYQRFGEKPDETSFIELWRALFQSVYADTEKMFKDLYKSYSFNDAVYEAKLTPVYSLIAQSLFRSAFFAILEAQENVGTVTSYLKILYEIFGSNAKIEIDYLNPMHIKINITARYLETFFWVDEKKEVYITSDDAYLVFRSPVARLTNRQLAAILQEMTNAGTYLEFTYQQAEPEE